MVKVGEVETPIPPQISQPGTAVESNSPVHGYTQCSLKLFAQSKKTTYIFSQRFVLNVSLFFFCIAVVQF